MARIDDFKAALIGGGARANQFRVLPQFPDGVTNTDSTGVHSFTSGTVDGFTLSPDGTFDTGVLMSGDSFEWTPTVSGEYPYYCMLHAWQVGTIIVN